MRKSIVHENMVPSCYFRSSVVSPERKALLQITERCNLNCVHCFLSSGPKGDDMTVRDIENLVIPRLKECKVVSVTLTGGEPFLHSHISSIVSLLKENGIRVGICSNGTVIKRKQVEELLKVDGVHVNASLDGFRPESHGRFRGDEKSFAKAISGIRLLGEHHLLQGILVTPNTLADIKEYVKICEFAIQNHASYVLMNPLSRMGRGVESISKLSSPEEMMIRIKEVTEPFQEKIEVVYVRFPNERKLPREVTICPYLIFAARIPRSKHKPEEFIVGNIFEDVDISNKLNAYNFQESHKTGSSIECQQCHLASVCGKGCPAAIIASGSNVCEVDKKVCPVMDFLKGTENE